MPGGDGLSLLQSIQAVAGVATFITVVVLLYKATRDSGGRETSIAKEEEKLAERLVALEKLFELRLVALDARQRTTDVTVEQHHGSWKRLDIELRDAIGELTESTYRSRQQLGDDLRRELGDVNTRTHVTAQKVIEVERRIGEAERRIIDVERRSEGTR